MGEMALKDEVRRLKATTAARLRELRAAAGLTREQAAGKSGVSYRSLEEYEAGRTLPGWAAVLAICDAYGCEPNDLRAPE